MSSFIAELLPAVQKLLRRNDYRTSVTGTTDYCSSPWKCNGISHVATVPCQQYIHSVNRCGCNMRGIHYFILWNCVFTHQSVRQNQNLREGAVQPCCPSHTPPTSPSKIYVPFLRFVFHILRHKNVTQRGNLLPPKKRGGLLDGYVPQSRPAAVQITPERRLAIDFQFSVLLHVRCISLRGVVVLETSHISAGDRFAALRDCLVSLELGA